MPSGRASRSTKRNPVKDASSPTEAEAAKPEGPGVTALPDARTPTAEAPTIGDLERAVARAIERERARCVELVLSLLVGSSSEREMIARAISKP